MKKIRNCENREFWSYNSLMGLIRQDFVETFRIKQNFWKNRIFCLSAHSIKDLRYIEFFETYGKTRFYPIRLIFFRHFQIFWAILFYSKRKVRQFLKKNEPHRSSIRQKLAPVAPRKFLMKIFFFEKVRFFRKMFFFEKSKILQKLRNCENREF